MQRLDLYQAIKRVIPSLFVDFFPILLFIFFARDGKIYLATVLLMLSTIVTTIIVYTKEKRFPYITLYIAFITILFGALTVMRHNIEILQIRDTLYDLSLVALLVFGLIFKVIFLKLSFSKIIQMGDYGWKVLTWLWIGFLSISALMNEYFRRYEGFHSWLHYKESIIVITIVFGIISFSFAYRSDSNKRENLVKSD